MSDSGKDEKIQHVSDSTFEQDVVSAQEPVLVDFWAPWCGPCKKVGPILEELAQKLEGQLKVAKMNVDENPSVPSQLGIRSIPTLVVYKEGKVVDTRVGALSLEELEGFVSQWICGEPGIRERTRTS
jgi:thioredoxin 1